MIHLEKITMQDGKRLIAEEVTVTDIGKADLSEHCKTPKFGRPLIWLFLLMALNSP